MLAVALRNDAANYSSDADRADDTIGRAYPYVWLKRINVTVVSKFEAVSMLTKD